jgi:hypothetical protein
MAAETPLLDALLSRLSLYCEAERGRKTELIKYLGIRPHMLSEWLSGPKKPGGEYTLAIQEWLAGKD